VQLKKNSIPALTGMESKFRGLKPKAKRGDGRLPLFVRHLPRLCQ
jgi:hypothetical protein